MGARGSLLVLGLGLQAKAKAWRLRWRVPVTLTVSQIFFSATTLGSLSQFKRCTNPSKRIRVLAVWVEAHKQQEKPVL